ncbi:autoinducer binding domain-containing protein [Qipengyuania aurantiaca]|uniref:Autoinducer binding domain-containing protein n=1 Tax=Qipengyuania aurantiaca TaxID=2867233 RepID=A0ABX8ZK19_9SPHN|nr:autoinducer binding domain-containing protein [Qipengyuania aurantiaca]QZD89360.1 autoinducer binding domain-containing protein [Qipengyuania aurantiaca]
MDSLFVELACSPCVTSLWQNVRGAVDHFGADKFSYHFTPVFASQVSRETQVMSRGFSMDWLDLYDSADFRQCDPIPDEVMRAGHTISWEEALDRAERTPEVERFIAALREHGIANGFGVPLYGPDNRDAYAAFGFPVDATPTEEQIVALTMVARAAHDRVCQLVTIEEGEVSLSQRELEVLRLIARGKSNTIIAQLLKISADTVGTYVKRLYAKLGASDRVGATVKALKLKLITV